MAGGIAHRVQGIALALAFLCLFPSCARSKAAGGRGAENTVAGPAFRPERILSAGPIFSVAADGKTVLWCAGEAGSVDQLSDRLIIREVGEGKEELFAQASPGGQLMPVRADGPWICWAAYGDADPGEAMAWAIYAQKRGGEKRLVASNADDPRLDFPNFEIRDGQVVFDAFVPSGSDDYDSPIMIHSLETGKTEILARMEGYDLYDPSIHGKRVIFCKLSALADGSIRSRLCVLDMASGKTEELDATDSGFQPSLNAGYALFKEAPSPYDYGKIRLHEFATGRTITLTGEGEEGEQPFLGEGHAVWESPLFDKIRGWDLGAGKGLVFAAGTVGKPYLKGYSLVWVAEESPGEPFIGFLDLR